LDFYAELETGFQIALADGYIMRHSGVEVAAKTAFIKTGHWIRAQIKHPEG
jgi:hypothetical protein